MTHFCILTLHIVLQELIHSAFGPPRSKRLSIGSHGTSDSAPDAKPDPAAPGNDLPAAQQKDANSSPPAAPEASTNAATDSTALVNSPPSTAMAAAEAGSSPAMMLPGDAVMVEAMYEGGKSQSEAQAFPGMHHTGKPDHAAPSAVAATSDEPSNPPKPGSLVRSAEHNPHQQLPADHTAAMEVDSLIAQGQEPRGDADLSLAACPAGRLATSAASAGLHEGPPDGGQQASTPLAADSAQPIANSDAGSPSKLLLEEPTTPSPATQARVPQPTPTTAEPNPSTAQLAAVEAAAAPRSPTTAPATAANDDAEAGDPANPVMKAGDPALAQPAVQAQAGGAAEGGATKDLEKSAKKGGKGGMPDGPLQALGEDQSGVGGALRKPQAGIPEPEGKWEALPSFKFHAPAMYGTLGAADEDPAPNPRASWLAGTCQRTPHLPSRCECMLDLDGRGLQ